MGVFCLSLCDCVCMCVCVLLCLRVSSCVVFRIFVCFSGYVFESEIKGVRVCVCVCVCLCV